MYNSNTQKFYSLKKLQLSIILKLKWMCQLQYFMITKKFANLAIFFI